MRLVILEDYDLASEWAAKYIRNRIITFRPTAQRYFTLGLPTGEGHRHTNTAGMLSFYQSILSILSVCLSVSLSHSLYTQIK